MKCFFHRDVDAIGLCKWCNRGLCPACAAEANNGLACRGRCEETVEQVNALLDKSAASYGIARGIYMRSALLFLVPAVVFFGLGWYLLDAMPTIRSAVVSFVLCFFFLLFSFSYYRAAKSYSRVEDEAEANANERNGRSSGGSE